MPFNIELAEEETDRDLLREFFAQLKEFLQVMCNEPKQYLGSGSYIEGGETILRSMWEATQPEFEQVQVAIKDVSLERLARAGLTGSSLRGKLGVVLHWARRLIASPGVAILRKILGAINTLLGSFVQATGVGELIKELKETVENVIDDATT